MKDSETFSFRNTSCWKKSKSLCFHHIINQNTFEKRFPAASIFVRCAAVRKRFLNRKFIEGETLKKRFSRPSDFVFGGGKRLVNAKLSRKKIE